MTQPATIAPATIAADYTLRPSELADIRRDIESDVEERLHGALGDPIAMTREQETARSACTAPWATPSP